MTHPRKEEHCIKALFRRLVVTALFASSLLQGAASFKGLFVRNEIGGPPIAGVTVGAEGANQTTSTQLGAFTLQFPTKKPGEGIKLVASKDGWVVVNWVQLDAVLRIDPGGANVLTLVLARESEREEMARRFFRLRSFEAIEANYKRLLADGNQDKARLQSELQQAKSAASKAAEDLAKFQPGQGSEMLQTAMRLFAEGKIDQALLTLDEAKLRQFSQAARERKDQAEKQLAQATQSWLLRARLLTTKFSFAEAEKSYEEAVRTSPEDFEASFAFADFLQNLNKQGAARQRYEQCLAIAKSKGDRSGIADTLNNLGNLHRDQHRMEEAGKAYGEALSIRRQLERSNPDTNLHGLAATLNNLGLLHSAQNRKEESREAYDEALAIRRHLALSNPDTYRPYVAGILNNLGNLHRDQNRIDDARKAYDAALATYRQLASSSPDTYRPYVAGILNNLGNLLRSQNRMEEARKSYDEALVTYRQLALSNPDTYLPDVALTLNNLGILHRVQNQMEEARKAYEEALGTYRQLALSNPDTYRPDIATTLINLGLLHAAQNRMDEAGKSYEEARATYHQLARFDPDTFLPYLARVYWGMGQMHAAMKQPAEARRAFGESLEIYQKFASKDSAQYQPLVNAVKADLAKLP